MLKGPSCFALDYIWRQRGSGQRKVCEMMSYTLQGSYITSTVFKDYPCSFCSRGNHQWTGLDGS